MWKQRSNSITGGSSRIRGVAAEQVVVGDIPMGVEVETAIAGEVGHTRMVATSTMISLEITIPGITIIAIEAGEVVGVLLGTTMVLQFQQSHDLVISSSGGLERCFAFA